MGGGGGGGFIVCCFQLSPTYFVYSAERNRPAIAGALAPLVPGSDWLVFFILLLFVVLASLSLPDHRSLGAQVKPRTCESAHAHVSSSESVRTRNA